MHADFLFQLIYLPYFNIRNCSWHLPPHESENTDGSENMNVHDYFGLIAETYNKKVSNGYIIASHVYKANVNLENLYHPNVHKGNPSYPWFSNSQLHTCMVMDLLNTFVYQGTVSTLFYFA